ncbi:phosphoribosylanthranilate isomerase [Rubellicoccus peritrichatus]|uniref:N-(5'-phosphoribosyl)anthranilate isomerase n=1 Tax=Rubellicoccus peritrichatus TaxID=3080537 RepID=A0AAQ3QSH7_9BACT|nr:phosphoribosylanthranilate isomerase [Puniceicoccus sp. CR14]WOO42473.1 phosphoribosylanthranilate isomerase [Puniceicoccus sp. CR14]
MVGSTHIKVCGLTKVEDGLLALELGADYLGVIRYDGSARMATEAQARLLSNSFPVGKRVCVDVAPSIKELEHHGDLGFDHFQIHFKLDVPLETIAAWSEIVGKENLWLAPHFPPDQDFPKALLPYADTFVIDTYKKGQVGGTGETGDWTGFANLMASYPDTRFILAGGLSPDNIREAVRQSGARVVDVNSGVEASPGIKDHDKLRGFFAALG